MADEEKGGGTATPEPLEVDSLIEKGDLEKPSPIASSPSPATSSSAIKVSEFLFCFFGLMISYVTWGIMQELIMNTKFSPTPMVPSGMFPSSTFCVFSNRALAIIVAAVVCYFKHGTVQSAASWLSFSPPALSNTISSWAQYESLSYVSFPLQNLFKSTKLIPVMIMGRLLNGTVYSLVEVAEAICISLGVMIFSMSKGSTANDDKTSSFHGIILLCTYIVSDSFTSQYQTSIYKKYGKIDQFHMMFGVNLSAIAITSAALVVSGELSMVMEFLYYNPLAIAYNVITAITSATGQMFIYYTIKTFGPVVFTIIMTTRQIVSMVVSTLYFHHPMPLSAVGGAVVVFSCVFHSIYRQTQKVAASSPRK